MQRTQKRTVSSSYDTVQRPSTRPSSSPSAHPLAQARTPPEQMLRTYLNTTPLPKRCREFQAYLQTIQNKGDFRAFHDFLPQLVSSIFGFHDGVRSTGGWFAEVTSLDVLQALRQFLSPNGYFLQILTWFADKEVEFPIKQLPAATQRELFSSVSNPTNPLLQGRLRSSDAFSHDAIDAITFNVVEYYYFCFVSALTATPDGQIAKDHRCDTLPTDPSLYETLLNDYLAFFLPSPATQTSPRRIKNLFAHLMPASHTHSTSDLKSAVCENESLSIFFVQSVVECWFRQEESLLDFKADRRRGHKNMLSIQSQRQVYVMEAFLIRTGSFVQRRGARGDAFRAGTETPMTPPSASMIRNGFDFSQPSSTKPQLANSLSLALAVAQAINVPSYRFLRLAVQHWPTNDSAFRRINALYRIVINPWKYLVETRESPLAQDKSLLPRWSAYVLEHFCAFTQLQGDFLRRSLAYSQMSSCEDALLFHDVVAAVFSIPALVDLLKTKEQEFLTAQSRSFSNCSMSVSAIRQHVLSHEGPRYQYIPLFSYPTTDTVHQLLPQLQLAFSSLALAEEDEREQQVQMARRSLSTRLVDWVMGGRAQSNSLELTGGGRSLQEISKHKKVLYDTTVYLGTAFNFDGSAELKKGLRSSMSSPNGSNSRSSSSSSSSSPDGLQRGTFARRNASPSRSPNQLIHLEPQLKESPLEPLFLSDAGREQLIRGTHKCIPRAVPMVCDPLTQPIRTYEHPALVRLFVSLSLHLNARFELDSAPVLIDASHASPQTTVAPSSFHFNLRFLASYRTHARILFFLSLLYILSFFFFN